MITIKEYRIGVNFFSIDMPKKSDVLKVHAPFDRRPHLHVLIDTGITEMETRNFLSTTVGESYPADIENLEHLGTYRDADLFEIKMKKLFK
ncbi:hypothetical protein KAU09_04565 [Candidatus Parcubacteria bacterium]|nr:hypothetical protein [Candidatus Parcubacteria bacterium]